MRTKKLSPVFILLFSFLALSLQASMTLQAELKMKLDIKLRFFQGVREGDVEPPQIITSSFLQPTVTATIKTKYLLAEELDRIKKVFNLKGLDLITEADLRWESEKGKLAHVFRLNGKEYLLFLSPVKKEYVVVSKSDKENLKHQFRIEIFEQTEEVKSSLLDTEIILPEKNIAVFGFEDKEGNPYFLSFHVTGIKGTPPPPPPPAPKMDFATPEEIKEFTEGAVEIVGEMKPPKLLKKVEPVYPETARKKRVEGVVILGVRTDSDGGVKAVKIYRSKDPLLDEAAVNALKQWVYEPLIIEGKSKEAVFTVTVSFKLKNGKDEEFAEGVVRAVGLIKPPKLVKKVDPIYPDEAKKARIQGVVILEVLTDKEGNVTKIDVLKSESSMLNQPAIDAVKQWKYEPMYIEGKSVPIVFTVTVMFKLK